ncbi:uncharacterized protein LOC126108457 [Schistocerca cancellata]|uniref:uncharacterized protein LOC126108457 n=1 Tax=Schistocerca cancellata TaxID=274614 RepID=UPI0021192CBB|nr:uncharacterized protein LOC126108457 [Schistocerca cancellata]
MFVFEMEGARITFSNLIIMNFVDGVIRWCIQRGLIAKERLCKKCSRPMRLIQRRDRNDGVQWCCSEISHVCRYSIRQKSWFAGSRLTIGDILKITYLWVKKCSGAFIGEELHLSKHTVVDWRSFCREVCVKDCIDNGDLLGGVGSVVEIVEAKLASRKFGRGKPVTGGWVYGGIERGSNKCFFQVVPKTTKRVFLNVLKKYVLPGTTVISDCFRSYDCLSDELFISLSVKHKMNFKDTEDTKNVEGTWSSIKRYFRGTNKCKDGFDSHMFEYMWRRRWSDENDLFIKFLEAVRGVYNPE